VSEYDELRARFLGEGRGALFEVGTSGACVTLLCADDDTVALYLSTGGGQLGLGEHEPVRRAATRFRAVLVEAPLALVPSVGLVGQDAVQLVRVTAHGTWALTLPEDDAASPDSPAFAAYAAGQDVVTQVRLLGEVHRERRTF
jgi:hypothetical protein